MGRTFHPSDLPRRKFLNAAIATPLAIEVTFARPTLREVDVIIVGAGLAGLTAAREFRRHKIRVCVIEARDRVGGRTLDHSLALQRNPLDSR